MVDITADNSVGEFYEDEFQIEVEFGTDEEISIAVGDQFDDGDGLYGPDELNAEATTITVDLNVDPSIVPEPLS